MTTKTPLYTLPVSARPSISWTRTIKAVIFFIMFNFGCVMVNGFQFVFLLPLRLVPFPSARRLYDEGIRYTKGAFGCLLILMCQLFAPTSLAITFEREGKGRFTDEELSKIIVKDERGNVQCLNLPTKFVLIANHQVYADWWYAWCLTYFMSPHGVHRYVYITLKKSLQWVPIITGMQFYNFIFLARSWASDRKEDSPLCFILYPEGHFKKYADKMGISDLSNILLPRSTGLHYSLRSLAPRIPDLKLLDITVVYPGIPLRGYGQSYYTLRSIFLDGVAPPTIHMHLRTFDVAHEVPIGGPSPMNPPSAKPIDMDIPDKEKEIFDTWLRELWFAKDQLITKFHEHGSFNEGQAGTAVIIPLKLRRKREALDAFCFCLPAVGGYLWGRFMG
ncbi:hypothetical protein BD779DRAFT_1607308 [Infundibulicybe gibba]|nr:hypothetical protein BD779DRAFT_1607308 [Infundibulicybe gibba]